MTMHEGVKAAIRIAEGDIRAFDVKVSLRQASVLLSVFCDINELQEGLPCVDDLMLMVESEENLHEKIVKWKPDMEVKGDI